MTIAFGEKTESRPISSGSQTSYSRAAIAFCSAGEDEDAVFTAACAETTLFPITKTLTFPGGDTVDLTRATVAIAAMPSGQGDPERFEVSVSYALNSNEPYKPGDSNTTFCIGFQSLNIKATKPSAVVGTYSTMAGGAPDHEGAIAVDGQGNVNGVDLDFPTYTWTETHILPDSSVTNAYKGALYAVANSPVNNASFKGFAAGEVKFMGVEGSQRGKGGDWELNFKFAASPNSTSIEVGDITGIVKKGWEILWMYFEESVATMGSDKARAVKARDVYVHQVYKSSDFSTMGIGT
jgi:hypothetical protein